MSTKIYEFFLNRAKTASIILGLILAIFLWFLDLALDERIGLSIFYVFPVILVTWNAGFIQGLVFSFLSSCFWFAAAFAADVVNYPIIILIWNTIVRLSFFVIISYTIYIFKNERKNARYDFLTRIPNRRYFNELFHAEVQRSIRYGHPLTITYMDVDNFKTVNDMLGHQSGDNLLKMVAHTIKKNIRSTDIVARLGGDEFAIMLLETGEGPALRIIQKVKEELLAVMNRKSYPVTFSFGLVTFRKFPSTEREMLKIADDYMYKAKKEGKNRIRRRVLVK